MRRRIPVLFLGFLTIFLPAPAFSDEALYAHVQHPPSHHVVTIGEFVTAHLLFPVDCRLRQSGDMSARTDDPLYNTIPGWVNEVIVPAGAMIAGSYQCYPRSIHLLFDRFLFRHSRLKLRPGLIARNGPFLRSPSLLRDIHAFSQEQACFSHEISGTISCCHFMERSGAREQGER